MADYCPNCFEVLDALHICDSDTASHTNASQGWHANQNLVQVVAVAPFAGVALDFVLPLPSSIVHSLAVSMVGSGLVSALWVATKYQGQKSMGFYGRNLKNFLYTPNMLKIFGGGDIKKAQTQWFSALAISTAIQLVFFTSGNATALANQVTAHIKDSSGVTLKTECPANKFFLYNDRIECRVKTGLLGLTVPARAKLSPITGTSSIKVSLL